MKGKVMMIQCVCCDGLESLSRTQMPNSRERTAPPPSAASACPDTRYMPSARGERRHCAAPQRVFVVQLRNYQCSAGSLLLHTVRACLIQQETAHVLPERWSSRWD